MRDAGYKVKVHHSDSKSAFLEWSVGGNDPQHEWIRILKDEDRGFYVLRYTTRKMDQVEKLGKRWTKRLKECAIATSIDYKKEDIRVAQLPGKMYEDQNGNFAIWVPIGWNIQTVKKGEVIEAHLFTQPERKGSLMLMPLRPLSTKTEYFWAELKHQFAGDTGKLIQEVAIERLQREPLTGEVIGPVKIHTGDLLNYFFVLVPGKDRVQPLIFSAKVEFFDEHLPIFKEMARSYQAAGF